jgi:hypothetical protein
MSILNKISNIFQTTFSYDNINKSNIIKMRNKSNGISLLSAVYYKFAYCCPYTTQESVTSSINYLNILSFSRQAFIKKEQHVPVQSYKDCFDKLVHLYNSYIVLPKTPRLIAVDGCNNNLSGKVLLNLGLFDISNHVPLDISFLGSKFRNGEVKAFKIYILNNLKYLKNIKPIFVCDRLYFTYDLLDFLDANKFHYIIRIKCDGSNLDPNKPLKKNISNYNLINKLRKSKIRVISDDNSYTQIVCVNKKKEKKLVAKISVKSSCKIVTNIPTDKVFTNEAIFKFYRSRWDIEEFFKFVKHNFKFQYLPEKNDDKIKKMYLCELILVYITKLIELYYWKKEKSKPTTILNKKNGTEIECTIKINYTNLMKGLFNDLLYDIILNNNISADKLDKFKKSYIKILKNEKGRNFPRTSKKPHSKWHLKSYSSNSQLKKIIKMIISNKINKLNKNLKVKAKRITILEVNGKEYG